MPNEQATSTTVTAETALGCLDGAVAPARDLRIPATDDGLLRGDGVFEVVRLYGGRPFALEEHLVRLAHSAAGLRLALDVAAVRADVGALLAQSGPVDALLRILATRGGRRLALLEPLPRIEQPARVAFVDYAPTRVLDGIKSLSYAANLLATRLAVERGFDEALLVTPDGHVLEAPTASVFWASGGLLRTPPLGEHILASITRSRLMALCDVREQPCTREDLLGAQEAFLASTPREITPIGVIERARLPAPGPLTAAAAAALRSRIEAELQGA